MNLPFNFCCTLLKFYSWGIDKFVLFEVWYYNTFLTSYLFCLMFLIVEISCMTLHTIPSVNWCRNSPLSPYISYSKLLLISTSYDLLIVFNRQSCLPSPSWSLFRIDSQYFKILRFQQVSFHFYTVPPSSKFF